ncbi:hypothetical protein JAAARDRAFT_447288 [Jaapia argillacea MUCL 33604]|uniref:Uncharacterized protein n=1 Tax=Jaapia argillacea MUCL 33604 TaxID=933084 RepID=A0A067P4U0_9AGAM|nr:hypothetical protein JAAARDRAFT_447288 [Jaapia argillacea MUCL 33604]
MDDIVLAVANPPLFSYLHFITLVIFDLRSSHHSGSDDLMPSPVRPCLYHCLVNLT